MIPNAASVSVLHGAPLRLCCENELGFKMVKWIAAIEFVHDFADLGAGERLQRGSGILRLPHADLIALRQARSMLGTGLQRAGFRGGWL